MSVWYPSNSNYFAILNPVVRLGGSIAHFGIAAFVDFVYISNGWYSIVENSDTAYINSRIFFFEYAHFG